MLRLARVAAVHPEDHSVDLVMVDDGSRHAGAQVMTPHGSTDSGTHDLPQPAAPKNSDKWSLTESTDRDMIAVVGFFGRRPLVMGFLYPQISQMMFKDQNRRVQRHASGVYSTIDGSGNFEMAWPNGTFLRVASDPAHEDLSGKDVDGKWKQSANTSAQLHVHLETAGAKAVIDIDPTGKITITNQADLSVSSQGNVNLTASGNLNLQGASVNISGPTAVSGGSLTHNGKNVGSDHKHTGVTAGPSVTGVPV